MTAIPETASGIDLYWLPLGAGGRSVRWNGRIFEWVAARLDRRDPCDLYHSALEVRLPDGRFVIERHRHGARVAIVASSPRGRSAHERWDGSGFSATRFGCGATVSFRTWRRPSTVHNSLLTIPTARGAS
jgi:hypothetical protein